MLAGIPVGLAVANDAQPLAHLDLFFGVALAVFAGATMFRDPTEALRLCAGGFLLHALLQLAHRPGWLPTTIVPVWYLAGGAVFDVGMAAACAWATWQARPA